MQKDELLEFLSQNEIEFEYQGKDALALTKVADLEKATSQEIAFFNDPKRKEQLKSTQAGLVILKAEFSDLTVCNRLIVKNPYYVYALLAQKFNPLPSQKGIHPSAVVDGSVVVPASCYIGPNVVIESGVLLGEGCQISAGCYLGKNVTLGKNCYLGPNVVIMNDCVLGDEVILQAGCVIGGEGFGFAPQAGQWIRIPQIGRVIIGNHVSIGNNTTIDRGTLQDTVIEDDCIIDNLVHIAHNVKIGQGSAIAAQTGFAGSSQVGKQCIFAGQAGVVGHLKISDGVMVMAKAGVTHSLKQPGSYSGFPAIPTGEWQKNTVRAKNLQKMALQIKDLEQSIKELKNQLEEK
ncbi:UDP-3-O-(3-hydroxymyristoyl)glucosamine N-acyltransferase [Thiosulfativibrio zosterae]|uniref:UDP-3-O-acylglucosamine N-acyltransferase n=1 Tax=Thiosulfativibrio zosterae TaxID=2675053 RepID=A0A6F8PNN6_9GAMM|nr:UDP-3-O-(3-hydroxymyristoyl)glucosamine N-acyltransferase [Thiosulfativibrio zosterae]BBP43647.1 UDP-3-O-acylglucosamine N-acyltransferase [Thiosulfativibrio zosterae]